jgi:hypothetical protein
MGRMTKKKAKKLKPAAKKAAKKKRATRPRKEKTAAEVRQDIAKIVKAHAGKMAEAVIDEGEKGQLPPVKYLFEVANIYPAAVDGSEATADEDSLAKTLLDRLGVPTQPIVLDEDDGDVVVIPAHVSEMSEEPEKVGEEVLEVSEV